MPLARAAARWFSLTHWGRYFLFAVASVCVLAVVATRTSAKQNGANTSNSTTTEGRLRAKPLAPLARLREPAWVDRHAFVKARAGLPADVLLLGDSITQGWLYQGRWDQQFPDISAVNAGIASDRVEHVLWRARDGLFSQARPKVVVLLAGVNNLALHDPDRIAATQAATIRAIHARSPATKVLLLGVFPAGASPDHARRAKIARVNQALARLADGNRVQFMDIGRRLLTQNGTLSKVISFDGVHLTASGYKIWAHAMRPKLLEMLSGSKASLDRRS